jgi:alpha-1,3-rhamnosyl/mannosyltransferase
MDIKMNLRIGISSSVLSHHHRRAYMDGIGHYTQTLADHLKQLHCDVIPVTYTPFTSKHRALNPVLPNGRAFAYPQYIEVLGSVVSKQFNQQIEQHLSLYHSTDYDCPRFNHIPVVCTVHDAILLQNNPFFESPIEKINRLIMKKRLQQHADHFIAISQAVVPDLVEYWRIKPEHIDVVHNGIPAWWWERVPEEQQLAVLKPWGLKKKYILFVSTLRRRKNLMRLIQAYESLPTALRQEYPLIVVGQDPGSAHELIQKLKHLSYNGESQWLNYVSQHELRVLYQCATVFVFPSLAEGFGFPIVEAFASRTPVITSNIGAMAEIAADSALLVDPYNIEQLRHAMALLLTDPSLAKDYADKGAQRSLAFTASSQANKMLAVYKKILST